MQSNLGKLVRLNDDGSEPADNPFADQGGVAAQVWSLGHRNLLGIDFDAQGRLWEVEMGPKGGDELNLVERGGNYGYPIVSNGDHRSEEHTSELQSLMRISYAVFCLKKKNHKHKNRHEHITSTHIT